jgi:hypothetical protein
MKGLKLEEEGCRFGVAEDITSFNCRYKTEAAI